MTRRPEHNRNRTRREQSGHQCTSAQAGAEHTRSPKRTGEAAVPAPPSLAIDTTARENAVWVRLRGEADLGNHEQLHFGLTRVQLDGAKAVHLELTELTFCDLCALRHLVAFAAKVREAGRELFSHGACPTIKKIARLLNVAHELHFV